MSLWTSRGISAGSVRPVAFGWLVCLLLLLVAPASPAYAHAALLSSSPVAGSVVPEMPAEVVLRFSEPVSPVKERIRVVGPDGTRADDGVSTDGNLVKIKLKGAKRGTYLVSYRVVSADSHPVPGGFAFSNGAPSQTPVELEPDGVDGTTATLIKVVKYAGYGGLAMLVGGVLVLYALWPSRLDRRGARRMVWLGFAITATATVAAMVLQVPYITGSRLADIDASALGDVLASQYGVVHLIRLAVLAVAAILVRPLLAGLAGPVDRVLLVGLAAGAALTWPLAGHPAASPVAMVSVVTDAVHLAGVSVWLGGLLMLAAYLLRLADERELGVILPVWSRWAGAAVSAVLLAGVVSVLIEVGSLAALTGTGYGRLVIAKIALVALMLVAALLARRLTLRMAPHARRPLRRVVLAELGIAALVLGVTATLTLTTPARTSEAAADAGAADFYSASLNSSLYTLRVEVSPARRGNNDVHLYAYTPDGAPLTVVQWRATAALPSAGVEPVEIPMLAFTANHASGVVQFPTAGAWQLRFTVRISEIDQASVSTTVPVK